MFACGLQVEAAGGTHSYLLWGHGQRFSSKCSKNFVSPTRLAKTHWWHTKSLICQLAVLQNNEYWGEWFKKIYLNPSGHKNSSQTNRLVVKFDEKKSQMDSTKFIWLQKRKGLRVGEREQTHDNTVGTVRLIANQIKLKDKANQQLSLAYTCIWIHEYINDIF